jgi:hypothetical protein
VYGLFDFSKFQVVCLFKFSVPFSSRFRATGDASARVLDPAAGSWPNKSEEIEPRLKRFGALSRLGPTQPRRRQAPFRASQAEEEPVQEINDASGGVDTVINERIARRVGSGCAAAGYLPKWRRNSRLRPPAAAARSGPPARCRILTSVWKIDGNKKSDLSNSIKFYKIWYNSAEF